MKGSVKGSLIRCTVPKHPPSKTASPSLVHLDAERLSLDLYLPGDAQPKPADAPIVLYLHGGGWQAGAKELSLRQPLVLVPEGFAFASVVSHEFWRISAPHGVSWPRHASVAVARPRRE